MASLKLFINEGASSAADGLVTGFLSLQSAPPVTFQQGDNARDVELHFLSPNPDQTDPTRPFVYNVPPTNATFAAGRIGGSVSSGTFTLTDTLAMDTTAAIAYNASAATVQAALRSGIPSSFGSCVVTGNAGGPWIIDLVTPDVDSNLTSSTSAISPAGSTMVIVGTQAATVYLAGKYNITLAPAPAILTTSWSPNIVTLADVTTLTEGTLGVNEVQRIAIRSDVYGGTFSLVLTLSYVPVPITSNTAENPTVVSASGHTLITGDEITIFTNNGSDASIVGTHVVTVIDNVRFSIPVDCTADGGGATSFTAQAIARSIGPCASNISEADLETALQQHPSQLAESGSFVVNRALGASIFYDVTFTGLLASTDIPQMVVIDSLVYPSFLSGTINARTSGVLALLNGSTTPVATNLEIQKTISIYDTTVAFRNDASIQPELISSTPGTPSAGTSYYTTMTGVGSGTALGILTLAGAGITALAGQVTLGQVRGRLIFVNDATYGFGLWENSTANLSEDIPGGILLANDFVPTTNESVWLRRL